MRVPEGFFRDLRVPEGAEVFQLPVRPSGVPAPGSPRVEALSLSEARPDDLARDGAGLPVRLRGKAMGFSPRAFRLGPAAATSTTAATAKATLRLLASGVRVRALAGPFAFDAPASDAGAMGRSRARWFGGTLKLAFAGAGDLLRLAAKSPLGAFVLACDLWLRPRILLLDPRVSCRRLGSGDGGFFFEWRVGGGEAARRRDRCGAPLALLVCLLLLSLLGKSSLFFEWLSISALRPHRLFARMPPVSAADLADSLRMWIGAAFRGAPRPRDGIARGLRREGRSPRPAPAGHGPHRATVCAPSCTSRRSRKRATRR